MNLRASRNANATLTQALFEQTPYEREFSASIVGISGNAIALDQTLFYPTGGGQPGDAGVIYASHEAAFQVIDIVRDGVRKEIIWHMLAEPAHLEPGTSIRAAIDWNRRSNLSREAWTFQPCLCPQVRGVGTHRRARGDSVTQKPIQTRINTCYDALGTHLCGQKALP
ncbi:alanine--tRNA ligase-related protein [Pollutimonas bauzanensis]|uniref:alanine--tRNA ligase-related protein n=1 Tax=Pollutimonas bauzanensis TaxID=658167 RepID=UPI00093355C5